MKKSIKHVLAFTLLVVLLIALYQYKLVIYGLQQLKGQMHIICNARDVNECLNDATVPDSIKQKLLLIGEIRRYAVDSLGLKDSKNYTTLYDQQSKPVLWVLTACEPFAMKAYEWNFPLLGAVSYKGFFDKEIGLPEEAKLKAIFYDTEYSPVSAWSTLGWFRDPVLSNMLKRKEGQIAELIIHELTHATVYLPSNVDYNENLATFVGEQGAIRFLTYKYGADATQTLNYQHYKADETVFGSYMVNACAHLDSVYQSINTNLSFRDKLKIKYNTITEIVLGINQLTLYNKQRYAFSFPGDHLPNNSWFLSYRRYRVNQNDFDAQLKNKYSGKLEGFIGMLRNQ